MDKLRKRLQKHMEYLCLECGPRQCGSKGERMAVDYIESEFKAMGYETVREEYPTIGWDCSYFSLWNVTKDREVPCVTAAYFSNAVDVEDTLLWLTNEDLNNLENLDLKGKFCFIAAGIFELKSEFGGFNGLSEILDSHGVKAAIFICADGAHTDLAPSTKYPRSPFLKSMGVATVSQQGAYDIAKNSKDVYRLVIKAEKFETVSCNVIARQLGGDQKGVIGAHYDTAPFIQGAEDNASGTAIMLEIARLFKDKYKDWSFDFCAFGAEEYIPDTFPPGSGDYIKRHKHENLKWLLNIDSAGSFFGKKVLRVSYPERLSEIKLNVETVHDNKLLAGDDLPFVVNGVPKVWLCHETVFKELHTVLDSLDTISYDVMLQYAKDYVSLFEQLVETK